MCARHQTKVRRLTRPRRELAPENAKVGAATQQKPKSLGITVITRVAGEPPGLGSGDIDYSKCS